jgi:hypothetical protein
MSILEFNPPSLFRNKHLQTILASKKSLLLGGMTTHQLIKRAFPRCEQHN